MCGFVPHNVENFSQLSMFHMYRGGNVKMFVVADVPDKHHFESGRRVV